MTLLSTSTAPLAITMGDAAGIGPEIIAKTFADKAFIAKHPSFVVGDVGIMRRAAGVGEVVDIQSAQQAHAVLLKGAIPVLATSRLPDHLPHGKVSGAAGKAAFDAIVRAIEFAKDGQARGVCTAPISKEALSAANIAFPGHTEMLAHYTNTTDFGMMLANPQLRTVLVTIHCSLLQAIQRISVELELRIIRLAHRSLQSYGITKPRIAVAGLNPHAGEAGMFGREDIDIIAPAIALARLEGIDASGPHPGDTVFMHARKGRYDIVVAQYHDQGLIPVKLLGVEDGVNVTLGLPFVRTSPDHGTAFDIAGKGMADESSMKTAIAMAFDLSKS